MVTTDEFRIAIGRWFPIWDGDQNGELTQRELRRGPARGTRDRPARK